MKRSFIFAFLSLILLLTSCGQNLAVVESTEEPNKQTKNEEKKPAIMQTSDPAEDDVFNLLMIGNSGCYYYVEELYGMAEAAGIKMNVCNLYYSGCPLNKHWTWWKQNESKYQFFVTNEKGRVKYENFSLVRALQTENWDAISLQEAFSPEKAKDRETSFANCEPYMRDLMAFLRKEFPQSDFFWHQTWSYEVGYDRDNGVIDSPEAQEAQHQTVRDVALHLCEKYNLARIPVGDAWQIARKDPVIGDKLCHKKGGVGDFLHDGDTGGGQYLNACVWLECLTGKSCIGNTWRPEYDLSEAKIAQLQKAAHESIEAMKG